MYINASKETASEAKSHDSLTRSDKDSLLD